MRTILDTFKTAKFFRDNNHIEIDGGNIIVHLLERNRYEISYRDPQNGIVSYFESDCEEKIVEMVALVRNFLRFLRTCR